MQILRKLFKPPVFEDETKTRLAGWLHVILMTAMSLLILFSIPALFITPEISRILIELTLIVWSVIMLVLLRRGYVEQAAFLMTLTLWVVVSYGTYQSGGFRGSIMASYFAIALIAQLLLGTRTGLIFGGLSIIFTGWLAYAESAGLLPVKASYATAITFWGEFSAVAIGMLIVTSLIVNSLRDALKRAQHNEQELAVKVAEAQKLTAEVTERNELLKSFIRRVGHETRTPLGAMLGFTEMIMDEPLTPKQQKLTRRIINNANDMTELFNALLDIFQIEANQLDLVEKEYALTELAKTIYNNELEQAENKNLSLKVEIDPQMPESLVGDHGRVEQIVSNLVQNAIKFTETGGVDVHFCKVSNTQWKIEVTDTGIGIAKNMQELIFKPFRQADESQTRSHGGLGLGLPIARELAVLMGGSIRVESEMDKGSRFTVTLPLVDKSTAETE